MVGVLLNRDLILGVAVFLGGLSATSMSSVMSLLAGIILTRDLVVDLVSFFGGFRATKMSLIMEMSHYWECPQWFVAWMVCLALFLGLVNAPKLYNNGKIPYAGSPLNL